MLKGVPMLRKFALFTGDIVILLFAMYVSVFFIFPGKFLIYYDILPIMIVMAMLLFNVNGLFSLARKKFSEVLLSLAVAQLSLLVVMLAVSFLFNEFRYSRTVLVMAPMLQFILLTVWKYIFWRIERSLIATKNVLLIGNEDECKTVIARLNLATQLNYQVRYICQSNKGNIWKKVADEIDTVILCADIPLKVKAKIVHFCHNAGKQVVLIPDIYELFCTGIEMDKIDDIPVFRPCALQPTLEQRLLKRLLDIVVSGTAVLFLWPIMLGTAIAIKFDSKGPAIFSQTRVGRSGKQFNVHKFRSMQQEAEKKTGPVLATANDPRITRIGSFIRATRLDELPQLLNVLMGDMSIVGPRPERPFFVEKFCEDIPEYVYRHNVKPGITGMAQVYGKYNTTPYNKLIYDLMYVQKCNILTDLVIMIQTLRILVTKSSTEGAGQRNIIDISRYSISQSG